MDLLTTRLQAKPTFHVITGPVNSSKSMHFAKLEEEMKSTHVPVLSINLRGISFNTMETLVLTLEDSMCSWLDQFLSAMKHFKMESSGYGFQLKTSFAQDPVPTVVKLKLNKLLSIIQGKLPLYTYWYGFKVPIFIIDEANKLGAVTRERDGSDSLYNFFKWLVLNTKEKKRFHVLLLSSNSFFHLWISKYIGTTRYETYVIGDLPKQDAKLFWEDLLKREDISHPLPDFETIYSIRKGNMFLIEKALEYWCSESLG